MNLNSTHHPLTVKEAAELLDLSHKTLNAWRYLGQGPKYYKVGRLVRYRIEDLREWMDTRVRGGEAE